MIARFAAALLSLWIASASAGTSDFDRLKPLIGHWQGTTEKGRTLRIDYRAISRDSAIVEAWQPGTSGETMTVFHRDGARVLATHYCAQGNQPRLVMREGSGALTFEYVDATNLADIDDSHLHKLVFEPTEGGGWDRIETYRNHGSDETSRLHLRRVDESR